MPSPINTPEIKRWQPLAMALPKPKGTYSVPYEVLLGEAIDVSRFCDKYWATVREGKRIVIRGLDLVASKPGTLIVPGIGDDIFSLVHAVDASNANYRLELEKLAESPLKRGIVVLGELRSTPEYYFAEDGVDDVEDERLAALAAAHPSGSHFTMDGLAVALTDYAAFCALHREKLDGFGGFSAALIDEAKELADALRLRPQVPESQTAAARAALDLRDRLLTLLMDRVRAVRAAARFVFRDDPDVIRAATSFYERQKRAAARRAAGEAADEAEPVGE